jgi:hypothetical protein
MNKFTFSTSLKTLVEERVKSQSTGSAEIADIKGEIFIGTGDEIKEVLEKEKDNKKFQIFTKDEGQPNSEETIKQKVHLAIESYLGKKVLLENFKYEATA